MRFGGMLPWLPLMGLLGSCCPSPFNLDVLTDPAALDVVLGETVDTRGNLGHVTDEFRFPDPITRYQNKRKTVLLAGMNTDDVETASLALVHIQRVYAIPVYNLTAGRLFEREVGKLQTEDFFLIGAVALRHAQYEDATRWLRVAEQLKYSAHHGNITWQEPPPGTREGKGEDAGAGLHGIPAEVGVEYTRLCSGSPPSEPQSWPRLYCGLQRRALSYGYWKVEHLHPEIRVFHDVISKAEIESLKNAAAELFEPSEMRHDSGTALKDVHRISHSAWITEDPHLTKKLDSRISDLTGLAAGVAHHLSDSEHLQVAAYPAGGVYHPHYDALGRSHLPEYIEGAGDRLATFMFYLHDVDLGGATVFPRLGVRIPAKQGTAAFWYNLHDDGTVDERFLHAGCPVLLGSKWIANKWIHEFGQMTRRPCDLHPSAVRN